MCCNNFWKKITVFSITLLLGFYAAEFFGFRAVKCNLSLPIAKQINDPNLQKSFPTLQQSERKNCVPADPGLKYRRLKNDSEINETDHRDAVNPEYIVKVNKKPENSAKSNNRESERLESLKNDIERLEELRRNLERYSPYKKLIYIEKCSEYSESMKVIPPPSFEK